ncbi:MAG: hypothetical protein ACREHG_09880, partial [Candidatus Saccharimonadales bacterium]
VAYYVYQHYVSSSSTSTSAAQAIDPTTGLPFSEEAIDPATGTPYSQEYGAAEQDLSTSGTDTTGATGYGYQTYSDNTQWRTAAINYLVGLGVPISAATESITNYLQGLPQPSQDFTNDVNLAVTALGPPPVTPTPQPTTGTGNPPPTSNKKPTKATRNVADGTKSLDQVAKERNTTMAHIVSTTDSTHGTGNGIDTANLAKFNAYVAKGTSKKMPKGLVFYTSNPTSSSTPGIQKAGG